MLNLNQAGEIDIINLQGIGKCFYLNTYLPGNAHKSIPNIVSGFIYVDYKYPGKMKGMILWWKKFGVC